MPPQGRDRPRPEQTPCPWRPLLRGPAPPLRLRGAVRVSGVTRRVSCRAWLVTRLRGSRLRPRRLPPSGRRGSTEPTRRTLFTAPLWMDSWLRPPFGCRGRRCSEHVCTRVRLSPGLRLFGGHTHVRADLLLRVAPLHLRFRGPADRSPPPLAGVCAPGRPGSASFRSVALRWVSGGVSLGFTLRFPDD